MFKNNRILKIVTFGAILLTFVAFGTWVKATPKNSGPLPDFVNWATAKAPATSEIMLALDGTKGQDSAISASEVAQLNQAVLMLEEVLGEPLLPAGGLKAEDIDWLGGQMAVFGSFGPDDGAFSGALIVSVRDLGRAQDKLKDKKLAEYSHFGDGWVCLATSEAALKQALDGNKPSLAQNERFRKACGKLSHRNHGLVYLDLAQLAPRALSSLKFRLGGDQEKEPKCNFADLETLAGSLQCLVGGEDIVDNRVLADLYLCADVKNSGPLGRVLFNPQANIAHPAFAERSAQSQFCYASNVRYDYEVVYNLLGIHPLTASLRDLPDFLLEQEGLSLKQDVMGGLLKGSMVSSVENLDVAKLLNSILQDAAKAGVLADTSQAGEKTEAPANSSQAGKTAEATAGSSQAGKKTAQEAQVNIDLTGLLDVCLEVWQRADWRVSLALQDGALDKLAARNEAVKAFVDGMLRKSGIPDQQKALDQRFAYLPAVKVVNNTLWVAGCQENCAPVAQGKARLGQMPALNILNDLCGTECCAGQWAVDCRVWSEALVKLADTYPVGNGVELDKVLAGRGTWQCGRYMVVPEGLRVCEVVELPQPAQVH